MREIKFRLFWYKKIYQINTIQWYSTGKVNRVTAIYEDGETTKWLYPNNKNIVLLQYTGLKDKNGKEIYEGDILNSLYRSDGCKGIYEVQWSDIRASFFAKRHGEHQQMLVSIFPSDLQRCEIIGNIYENPDLLKV
jgi:uncharacterized phage protein (TIGR01671 family)